MSKECKLVSIIIQAYNSSATIEQTLNSVKEQTYPDIELIISDDKSSDDTVSICKEWLKENGHKFLRVKLIASDINTGISGSNNRALKEVTGQYACFLAADDCMTPDAAQEYVKYCEDNADTVPIARVELFSDDICDLSPVNNYCEECYKFALLEPKEQLKQLLIKNRIVAPAASFYPIEVLKKCKGFDEAYRLMEDYPINLKILTKGFKFGLLDKKLIYYRISNNSVTGSSMPLLKMTEAKMFFRLKFWYMFQNKMGWEALKQSRYWIKTLLKKGYDR